MRLLTVVLTGCLLCPPRAAAQFGLSAELGLGFMGGTDRDTSSADVGSLRPYRPTQFTLRPEWQFKNVRVALGLTYSTPNMAVEGTYTIVSSDSQTATLIEMAPEVSYRLLRTGTGVSVHLHGGPVVDLWTVFGNATTEVGGQLALSLEVPLASRIHMLVRGSGVVTSSVFDKGDLPPEVEVQKMRRGTIALGVRYGP
jgi:hypothetical protein